MRHRLCFQSRTAGHHHITCELACLACTPLELGISTCIKTNYEEAPCDDGRSLTACLVTELATFCDQTFRAAR